MQNSLSAAKAKIDELVKKGVIAKNDIKNIEISTKPDKKLMVVLENGRIVHFGSKSSTTFLEGASDEKRQAYIKRHTAIKLKNGDLAHKVLFSPAWLSLNILW